jgi:uncharacterized protein
MAKAGAEATVATVNCLQNALSSIDVLLNELPSLKRKSAGSHCDAICGHLSGSGIDVTTFEALFTEHKTKNDYNTEVVANQREIVDAAEILKNAINDLLVGDQSAGERAVKTADSPLFIGRQALDDPSMINRAVAKEDSYRVEAHLTTLKLRLRTRLDDKRWQSFLNYEKPATSFKNLNKPGQTALTLKVSASG